jgi:hypothetical protein
MKARVLVNVLMVIVLLMTLAGCWEMSKGDRVGTIYKFSNKGMGFKTWEGELIPKDGSMTKPWQFSVDRSEMVEKVKAAQSCKGPVMLTYTEEWMVAPWRADSKYFIQDVKCEQ